MPWDLLWLRDEIPLNWSWQATRIPQQPQKRIKIRKIELQILCLIVFKSSLSCKPRVFFNSSDCGGFELLVRNLSNRSKFWWSIHRGALSLSLRCQITARWTAVVEVRDMQVGDFYSALSIPESRWPPFFISAMTSPWFYKESLTTNIVPIGFNFCWSIVWHHWYLRAQRLEVVDISTASATPVHWWSDDIIRPL